MNVLKTETTVTYLTRTDKADGTMMRQGGTIGLTDLAVAQEQAERIHAMNMQSGEMWADTTTYVVKVTTVRTEERI